MPLDATSPISLHILQNLSLILLSLAFTPLLTLLTILSTLTSPVHPTSRHISQTLQQRKATTTPKTILVTGLGMAKGLTIARSLYRAGHTVIGADFEPYHIPVCGRFSRSLKRFHRLSKPQGQGGAERYIQDLIAIVKRENVDLWISCSGVASAIEDGEARDVLEAVTGCKAVQFDIEMTAKLHEKDSFIACTRALGLNVPDTYPVRSLTTALSILYPTPPPPPPEQKSHSYVLKFTGTDDALRADMTLLPLSTRAETESHIARLKPSPARPFVLQQFIAGPEYCTHSIAVRGRVVAFTACRSSELLMHYRALEPLTALFGAFLRYTQMYAEGMGKGFTGHFSIDFLVDGAGGGLFEGEEGEGERSVDELMGKIFPIECNPRAHTAAVLFADRSEEVAEAYLSLLYEEGARGTEKEVVMPGSGTPGYYWVGHDLVTRVLLPILYLLQGKLGLAEVLASWVEFRDHLLYWKDGTYEIWDPWPFWWLYVVYWPGMYWMSLLTGNWWSRCNVSTTKLFRCS